MASQTVIPCNLKFGSLRIEDPRRSPPSNIVETGSELYLAQSVPELGKHFVLEGKIGEGTFSKVFKARLLKDRKKEYALKYIIPTIKPERIATELRYLRDHGGVDNVCGITTVFQNNGHAVFVLPYFEHDKFAEFISILTVDEIREYMKHLLVALNRIHGRGVIHRDVKPTNFLYNHRLKKYLLVDFGLAQNERDFDVLKKSYAVKAQPFKESTNQQNIRPILPVTTQIGKPENKKFAFKKRSHEDTYKVKTKKIKTSLGAAIPIESSVFQTPETPTGQEIGTPQKGFKTPEKSKLKTPVNCRHPAVKKAQGSPKTPSRQTEVSVIPETPLKTTTKDGLRMNARRQILYEETPKSRLQDKNSVFCECYMKPQICKICERKNDCYAPRAGTPGFRPPEVLLKTFEQSTKIDIWAAGVIFLCLLSNRYPFFRNGDDLACLAEIIELLGFRRVQRAAKKLGKCLTIESPAQYQPKNLRKVCEDLRGADVALDIPDSAFDLLDRLIDPCPLKRITASEALGHSFFQPPPPPPALSTLSLEDPQSDLTVQFRDTTSQLPSFN